MVLINLSPNYFPTPHYAIFPIFNHDFYIILDNEISSRKACGKGKALSFGENAFVAKINYTFYSETKNQYIHYQ